MWRAWSPVLVAGLLRLAIVLLAGPDQQRVFNSDSYEYHELARNLASHGRLTRDEAPPYRPETMRTPLFPALGASLYLLVGPRYGAVLICNVVLACVIATLLARTDPERGPVAAWIYALDPTSAIYSAMYVAETLFCLTILGTVLATSRALASGRIRHLVTAGMLAGLAVLAKPAATYLPLGLLVAAIVVLPRRRAVLTTALALLLGWLAIAGPWLARNRVVTGVWMVSPVQEINLLFWNVGVLEGSRLGIDRRAAAAELHDEIERRTGVPADELDDRARMSALRHIAVTRIVAHPIRYATLHLRGAAATLLDPGRLDQSRLLGGVDWDFGLLGVLTAGGTRAALRALLERPPTLLIPLLLTVVWLVLLYTMAVRSIWRDRRILRSSPLLALALITASYLALIGGPIGNARFRVPLVPLIALLAAGATRPVRHSGIDLPSQPRP